MGHFITPLALYSKRSNPSASWGDWNPKGKGKSNKGSSGKGKSKGKGAGTAPDGSKICFRFNQGNAVIRSANLLICATGVSKRDTMP